MCLVVLAGNSFMEQPQLHWHGSDKKKTAVPWFEALQGRVLAFSEHCMSWVGFQAEERSRKQNDSCHRL